MSKRHQLRKRAPIAEKRQKFSQPFSLRHTNALEDEISSEEELETEESQISEGTSEDERVESSEEKRHRLAKAYLSQIDRLEDVETNQYDHVADQLRINRLKSSGKYYHTLSENLIDLDWTSIPQYQLNGHQGAITCVSLTVDETTVFSGSKDNSVFKWDVETGARSLIRAKWNFESQHQSSHQDEILTSAVTSDGRYLAVAGRAGKVYIHDHRLRFSEVKSFEGHRGYITSLAFQYDTYSLFSASSDRCIKYWDLNEMAYIETLFGHQDDVLSIDCWHKLKPLSCSSDRTLRGWKVEANSHLVFRGHKAPIDVVKILTDDTFVSGSQDGRLSLWKETRKLPVSSIESCHGCDKFGNANWITAISTIKSSDLLASGSWDGNLKLWSAREDKLTNLASIPVQGCINSIQLSKGLIVVGCGREHKLGRWINSKGLKNRITVIKLNDINK